jgi:hypothetical protein
MTNYTTQQLSQFPSVAERARATQQKVSQVMQALQAKDGAPTDQAQAPGDVFLRESSCVVHEREGSHTVDVQNAPDHLITTDTEKCLSEGVFPVRIEGVDRLAGFKGLQARMQFDPASGNVVSGQAVGYEIYPGGFAGPQTFTLSTNKRDQQVLDVECGGFHSRTTLNADGTIAQFSEGSESFWDWLPWKK